MITLPEGLLFSLENGVGTLTLNRPDKMNAVTTDMYEGMESLLQDIKNRDDVKVLVLTGAGKAFCAGSDVGKRLSPQQNGAPAASRDENIDPVMLYVPKAFREFSKPSIAMVNGVAAGGGLSLALLCDMRIVSDRSRFIPSWGNIGLHPDLGATYCLAQLLNPDVVLKFLLSGTPIDAPEALRVGMVTQVVPHEELTKTVTELASKIARGPSLSINLTKRAVQQAETNDFLRQLYFECYAQNICARSEDFKEGVKAFAEKRPPNFKGN